MCFGSERRRKHIEWFVDSFLIVPIIMFVLSLRETQAQTPSYLNSSFWFPKGLFVEYRWKEERASRAVCFIRPVSVACIRFVMFSGRGAQVPENIFSLLCLFGRKEEEGTPHHATLQLFPKAGSTCKWSVAVSGDSHMGCHRRLFSRQQSRNHDQGRRLFLRRNPWKLVEETGRR